mmetsp:Transcript_1345/g.2348  ORF Transcript_1345/g.2348 Transcript_1345/m.2348 type:complete len:311 (-) Transcript_1345:2384-3316(-)
MDPLEDAVVPSAGGDELRIASGEPAVRHVRAVPPVLGPGRVVVHARERVQLDQAHIISHGQSLAVLGTAHGVDVPAAGVRTPDALNRPAVDAGPSVELGVAQKEGMRELTRAEVRVALLPFRLGDLPVQQFLVPTRTLHKTAVLAPVEVRHHARVPLEDAYQFVVLVAVDAVEDLVDVNVVVPKRDGKVGSARAVLDVHDFVLQGRPSALPSPLWAIGALRYLVSSIKAKGFAVLLSSVCRPPADAGASSPALSPPAALHAVRLIGRCDVGILLLYGCDGFLEHLPHRVPPVALLHQLEHHELEVGQTDG